MFRKLAKSGLLLLLLCSVIFSTNKANAQQTPDLKVGGATILEAMMLDFADLYQNKYGNTVYTEGGGANIGLQKMIKGELDVATVTRPLKQEEKDTMICKTIGYDALVFIVNVNNPVNALTKQQIVDIYTGKITNWKDLGGSDSLAIPVIRDSGGAMSNLFKKYSGLTEASSQEIGINGKIKKDAHLALTTYDSIDYILSSSRSNAISFTTLGGALSFIKEGSPIKILIIDGITVNKENIVSKKYPISTELNLVYKSETDKIKKFVDLFSSLEGKKIIEKNNSIPVN